MKLRYTRFAVIWAASLCFAAPAFAGSNLDAARDLVNKGNFLMASGKFAEALDTYEKAQKFEPSNVIIKDNIGKVYNNWAISLTKQKKYSEALTKLNKCLEVLPGYGQARRNIALLKQMATDDGIDLDAPPDEQTKDSPGGKLPDGGWLPGHEPKSGAAVIAPKMAPVQPDAGAVLFIGGVRQTTSTESSPAFVEPVTSAPPSAVATPHLVQSTAAPVGSTSVVSPPATFVQKNVNPMYPSTPVMYPTDAVHATSPAVTSSPSVASSPSATAPPAVSFDEQLTAVEMKVYGAKQNNLTVLQRLEKIEKDSQGQVRSGSIVERINYLKSSYGL